MFASSEAGACIWFCGCLWFPTLNYLGVLVLQLVIVCVCVLHSCWCIWRFWSWGSTFALGEVVVLSSARTCKDISPSLSIIPQAAWRESVESPLSDEPQLGRPWQLGVFCVLRGCACSVCSVWGVVGRCCMLRRGVWVSALAGDAMLVMFSCSVWKTLGPSHQAVRAMTQETLRIGFKYFGNAE